MDDRQELGGDGGQDRLEGEGAQEEPGDDVPDRPGHHHDGDGETNGGQLDPLNPLDPLRMVLSNEEKEQAQRIKSAIEQNKELDNLTDFAYAQLALIEENSIDDVLERATQLQSFREEYKILDTFEDGCRSTREFVKMFPGMYLSFALNTNDGNYCLVYDLVAFDLNNLLTRPEYMVAVIRGFYYVCHTLSPEFHAIRKGAIFLAECQGLTWKKNMNIAMAQQGWSILAIYPFQFQKLKYFHTGFFMNMINSLKKRFLPRSITDKIESGCQIDGRLNDLYLVPTPEAAMERLLIRMEFTLGLRYDNENEFRLPTSSGEDIAEPQQPR